MKIISLFLVALALTSGAVAKPPKNAHAPVAMIHAKGLPAAGLPVMSIQSPRDLATGQASGKRSVMFSMPEAASKALFMALCDNENLSYCEYEEITFTFMKATGRRTFEPVMFKNGKLSTVSTKNGMCYQKITWTFVGGGVQHLDSLGKVAGKSGKGGG